MTVGMDLGDDHGVQPTADSDKEGPVSEKRFHGQPSEELQGKEEAPDNGISYFPDRRRFFLRRPCLGFSEGVPG
jgi:hypothetical protein